MPLSQQHDFCDIPIRPLMICMYIQRFQDKPAEEKESSIMDSIPVGIEKKISTTWPSMHAATIIVTHFNTSIVISRNIAIITITSLSTTNFVSAARVSSCPFSHDTSSKVSLCMHSQQQFRIKPLQRHPSYTPFRSVPYKSSKHYCHGDCYIIYAYIIRHSTIMHPLAPLS